MSSATPMRQPQLDWLTTIAIAAMAISIHVAVHEGVHALACLAVGGNLEEYSALYVSCDSNTPLQAKIVDGSAPTFNLLAGVGLWLAVRAARKHQPETWFFLWLLMLMNWLYGAGYWMFSGIANIGDMATVIAGWQPVWLWRALLFLIGAPLFMLFVWVGLQELGQMIGGETGEQIGRARKLGLLSYFSAAGVVLLAGAITPTGFLSLPVTAGLLGVLGALSPLLWMMSWFEASSFVKAVRPPLEIRRKGGWLTAAAVVILAYVFILGRTIYFS